jgi:hypothetical protein
MAEPSDQIQVQVTWEALESSPVMASNVFMVLQTPHEFIVSFGFASPPEFTKAPTVEELRSAKITARPIVRLSMPPGRVVELLQLLQQQLNFYQQQQKH